MAQPDERRSGAHSLEKVASCEFHVSFSCLDVSMMDHGFPDSPQIIRAGHQRGHQAIAPEAVARLGRGTKSNNLSFASSASMKFTVFCRCTLVSARPWISSGCAWS